MIHVDRDKIRIPSVFVGEDCPAALERKSVIDFFLEHLRKPDPSAAPKKGKKSRKKNKKSGKEKKKSFDFKVYSHGEVKDALAQLFHGKCAYCETRYAATQPVDVEHYRPKAGVAEDKSHLGYYWLAASWENLLPSCIDCNRIRGQQIPIEAATASQEATTRGLKLGKGNRFPLAGGSLRSKSPEDNIVEDALLLDPCRDYPEHEFEFTDDGIVRPSASVNVPSKASTSIEVYGLNRTGLVVNRLEVLRLVQARMFSIVYMAKTLDRPNLPDDIRALLEDLLSHELAELHQFQDRRRPYTLMCIQVIDRFLAGLIGEPALSQPLKMHAQALGSSNIAVSTKVKYPKQKGTD